MKSVSFADYEARLTSSLHQMASGAAFPLSVTSAFNLAIEKASAECPQVDALLAYLADCAPGLIPMTLVDGAIGDETQLRKGIDTLDAASLLKFGRLEDGTSGVELHRLVQLVAQERSKQRGTKNDAVLRLAARLDRHPSIPVGLSHALR